MRTSVRIKVDLDELARMLEEGLSLEEIGRRVGRHPSTVGYWVKKHGLKAAQSEKYAARGGPDQKTLEALVAEGLTIRQIADELSCCGATVRHWLQRYGLRTRRHRRVRPDAVEADVTETVAECPDHGATMFIRRQDGAWRCLKCRSRAVSDRRRRVKAQLVAEAGGACVICGYDRSPAALHFHHVDPATKRLALGGRGLSLAIEVLREEAAKCVLLCATHHAEVEAGVATLPLNPRIGAADDPK